MSIKESCNLVGISRSSYYCYVKDYPLKRARAERCLDEELLEEIEAIKSCHPFRGYRRVTAFLKHRLSINVNHKKVYGIMKEHNLTMPQAKRREMRPGSGGSKPRAERPNEYWGIDMTKFMVESVGWVYLVVVLYWYTEKIVGWNLSLRSRSSEWKEALDIALNNQFPDGVRRNGLKLVSDNGSQPTSRSFMQDMATSGIEQIFTSYNNPKGNADTERIMRTIEEEVVWINEFSNFQEAYESLGNWIEFDYNKLYVHSALGYLSPEEFEGAFAKGHCQAVA